MYDNTYGERASTRWGGTLTPPRPLVRTQPEREAGTTYLLTVDHRTVATGRSLERIRTEALRLSLSGDVVHCYRTNGGRLTHRAPIFSYFGGERL